MRNTTVFIQIEAQFLRSMANYWNKTPCLIHKFHVTIPEEIQTAAAHTQSWYVQIQFTEEILIISLFLPQKFIAL